MLQCQTIWRYKLYYVSYILPCVFTWIKGMFSGSEIGSTLGAIQWWIYWSSPTDMCCSSISISPIKWSYVYIVSTRNKLWDRFCWTTCWLIWNKDDSFTPHRFQSVGEFPDTHLFAASTFNIYFSSQQTNKWCRTCWDDLAPLILLSEPTALPAGVQNAAAFWEMWFNAEGQKLSLGALAAEAIESLSRKLAWPMLNYSEKVPVMRSYLLRAISLPVSCTLLSLPHCW